MPRQDIEKHVELECEYTVIACKFRKIGCTTEMKRGDMAAHEQDDSLHLSKALNALIEMQESKLQLQEKVLKLESSVNKTDELNSTLNNGQSITFKVTEFQEKMDKNGIFTSPSFYTSPGGYHMAIRVYTVKPLLVDSPKSDQPLYSDQVAVPD